MGIFGPSKNEIFLQQEVARLSQLLLPEQQNIEYLNQQIYSLQGTLNAINSDIYNKNNYIAQLQSTIYQLNVEIENKRRQISVFDTDLVVQEYGLYKPTFEFANSDLYKDKLKEIRERQKICIKSDNAVKGSTTWEVNGSAAKGRALVNDNKKLLLRAFNVECDDIVSNVRISNLERSVERIYKTSEQISKLGKMMSISISPEYIQLKVDEVKLALDYQQKKHEEKERQKELRAQAREEAKVLKEIEEARKKLNKEQAHYQNALDVILSQIEKNGETQELLEKKADLIDKINDTQSAIQSIDYREANHKAGYVYIISNIGAFGENIYKIGMTRRLDPQERIDELGDASVPFGFDKHALIFSEDAPSLEAALHRAFENRKVNKINTRREFFNVTLDEIKTEVRKNFDKTVEWIDIPEAEQYRQSKLL